VYMRNLYVVDQKVYLCNYLEPKQCADIESNKPNNVGYNQ